MIFSDRDLRKLIEAGRLGIEPFDPDSVQPSSIDLRVGSQFRVFANSRYPYIDVRQPMEDLTELVEATEQEPFILHPGEFVLAVTLERVSLPDDVVGRLEGKSSLGRLGLLIHSSLPGSEPVLIRRPEGPVEWVPIEDIVRKRMVGEVVAFDPETFEVQYSPITGWYEGPPDRIFEVILASGRSVRVTAGHNLFTLDPQGQLDKVRTAELKAGVRVAIPHRIPGSLSKGSVELDLLSLASESDLVDLVVSGPPIERLFSDYRSDVIEALNAIGIDHYDYYRQRSRLPARVALQFGSFDRRSASVCVRGSIAAIPSIVEIDEELAWLFGLYVAEGSRRTHQVVWSNTDQGILDRVQGTLTALGLNVYRSAGAVTCTSSMLSRVIGWIGAGDRSYLKRIPPMVFSWPDRFVRAFLDGFVDGDGSRRETEIRLWTSSPGLVADFLALLPRLELRSSASLRSDKQLYQISIPYREHKLLTAVPLADRLLVGLRRSLALSQVEAARLAGYSRATDLCNIERRSGRDAIRRSTLRRLKQAYSSVAPNHELMPTLARLTDGDLLWDEVVEVRDTGEVEPIYDIEVRPDGRKVENFLAGSGGVFVSNTAGFVDAGFDGYLTLELSNVANLPITIYPGMKIGQISLFQMTSAAEHPYGSRELGSKYLGQEGPTPSRYFENFKDD